jgi:hypothetical protein
MGSNDLAEMKAGRMDPEGQSLTQAGQIMGIIGSVLTLVGILGICVWIAFAAAIVGVGAGMQP